MSNCTSDDSCEGPLVCYRSPQWTSEKNFCDCESWYGWVGDNCLDLGSGSVLLFIAALLITILGTITLVLTLDQLRRTVGKQPKPMRKRVLMKKENGLSKYCFNTAAVTLTFLSASLFGVICWHLNLMVIITHPQENTFLGPSNGGMFKLHQRVSAERFFVGVAVLFLVCALLEVSLVLLEIGEATLSGDSILRTQKYRRVINGFQVFWALLYIICASIGEMALLTFLTMPIFIFVMITFLLARHLMYVRIRPLLQDRDIANDTLQKTIDTIESTTRRLLVVGILVLLGGGIYVILALSQYYRDIVTPRSIVNVAAFFSTFVPAGILAASMVLLWNVYETPPDDTLVNQIREWAVSASDKGKKTLQNIQEQASKRFGSFTDTLASSKYRSKPLSEDSLSDGVAGAPSI